jgi:hypothetical protein
VCWSIAVKDKPTAGTPFFGPFPSDGIPKDDKGCYTFLYSQFYNFPRAVIPVNYASAFRQLFEATTCLCYKFIQNNKMKEVTLPLPKVFEVFCRNTVFCLSTFA